MIKTINGWRGFFALVIVLFHVGVAGLEEATWAGVTFFLMASGFLMAFKYPMQSLDATGYRGFAWRHAMKLFPLHWLTLVMWLAAMAMLGMLQVKPLTLALNATLLHSWSLTHAIYFSLNKFSWFLSTLLFCYLCYPLLARWFRPMRMRHKLIIIAVLAVIDFAVLAGSDDYSRTALYVFPPVRLIDFVIGITLADGFARLKELRLAGQSKTGTDMELASAALLSAIIWTLRTTDKALLPWSDAIVWWVPVALILVGTSASLTHSPQSARISSAQSPTCWPCLSCPSTSYSPGLSTACSPARYATCSPIDTLPRQRFPESVCNRLHYFFTHRIHYLK